MLCNCNMFLRTMALRKHFLISVCCSTFLVRLVVIFSCNQYFLCLLSGKRLHLDSSGLTMKWEELEGLAISFPCGSWKLERKDLWRLMPSQIQSKRTRYLQDMHHPLSNSFTWRKLLHSWASEGHLSTCYVLQSDGLWSCWCIRLPGRNWMHLGHLCLCAVTNPLTQLCLPVCKASLHFIKVYSYYPCLSRASLSFAEVKSNVVEHPCL